ncbi:MAG: hypothetical protein KDC95_01775 [Planctomycetes bacterium]|nr:hypothetical protein [Planctomycetota bacterium]
MHKISGYTICFDANARGVDLEASIRSFLQVCDEVVVVDCNADGNEGGDSLRALSNSESRLRIVHEPIDRDSPSAAFDLMFARPTRARQECNGTAVLNFDLGDFADADHRDDLRALADRLEFEEAHVGAYALPRAVHAADPRTCDASLGSSICLSRNDPFYVHDLQRSWRRFQAEGTLRIGVGTQSHARIVRNDTLNPVPHAPIHDPRIEAWIEDARGVGSAALLARDELQIALNAAFEVQPTIVRYLSEEAQRLRIEWMRDWWLPKLIESCDEEATERLRDHERWDPWLLASCDLAETFTSGTSPQERRSIFVACGRVCADETRGLATQDLVTREGAGTHR